MAKRIGKYNIGKHETKKIATDGGHIASLEVAGDSNIVTLTGDVNINGEFKHKKIIRKSLATETVSVAQSGQVIVVDNGSAAVYTLPTPAKGLHYKFIMGDTESTNVTIRATSDGTSAATIANGTFLVGTAAINGTEQDDLVLGNSGNKSEADWIEVWCDGTHWWMKGASVVTGNATLA